MKHTLQRALSVLLAVLMLAGTITALPISAEKPAKALRTADSGRDFVLCQ